ncbi:putative tumor suppressor candidate 2 isoform 2 [Scophthalmus maximus]|uniref:Putative tumor suppressor candidate 2 isoform 2 n=1 Tax=Scophthalmus maximus TaxID=52904 RepID=A0A2U9BFB0_SCOMX|nr:putative tumor suppressor candidate 2 isoform 2 [Scophthalmus maximus]
MGGSGSKAKGVWPFSGSVAGGDSAGDGNEQSLARLKGSRNATPFVFTRRRIQKNLIPQGIIKLDHPCIHVDFPIILCEV